METEINSQFHAYPTARRIGVIGNPGIGKTFFSFYLLMKAARDGKAVVYESRELSGGPSPWYILHDGIACVAPYQHPYGWSLLKGDNTLYLVDGCTPMVVDAMTVLVTSPRLEIYDHFCRKRSCIGEPLYLPVWSWEELLTLRDRCFPDTEVVKMKEVYDQYGGIARDVFIYTDQIIERKGGANDPLVAAIARTVMDQILTSKALGTEGDVSHRLFHAVSSAPKYTLQGYDVASPYATDLLMTHLATANVRKLAEFTLFSSNEPLIGALRGFVFEYLAHKQLEVGGTFQIKNLGIAHAEETLVLPKSVLVELDRVPVASDAVGGDWYLKPKSKTFAAVDSVLCTQTPEGPCAYLLQMHSGQSHHDVKHARLKDLLSSLAGVNVLGLFFVVPKDKFASYVKQNYVDERHRVVTQLSLQIASLTQYALCCDVGESRGVKRKR